MCIWNWKVHQNTWMKFLFLLSDLPSGEVYGMVLSEKQNTTTEHYAIYYKYVSIFKIIFNTFIYWTKCVMLVWKLIFLGFFSFFCYLYLLLLNLYLVIFIYLFILNLYVCVKTFIVFEAKITIIVIIPHENLFLLI